MKKSFLFFLGLCVLPFSMILSCDPVEPDPNDGEDPVALAKPEGLKGESTDNSIVFTWNAVENAKCYSYIFEDGDEVYVNETTVTMENLQSETAYTFKVKAVSGDLEKWLDSQWAEVTVTTGEEPVRPFAIDITGVTFHSVEMKISPLDAEMTYITNPWKLADFESYASTEEFAKARVDSFKEAAAVSGMTLEQWLSAAGILLVGEQEYLGFINLESDTDYVAYVFGLDYQGNITSEVVYEPFKTEPEPQVEPSSMTFELSVTDITDISAKMTMKPSVDDEYYYAFFVNKENYDYLGDEYIIQTCIDDLNEYISSSDWAEVVAEQCFIGEDTFSYGEFDANTEYVGFTFGVGQQGLYAAASTDLFVSDVFMTKSPSGSDGPIRIEVINFEIDDVQIKFIPSPEVESYRCELLPLSNFGDVSDAEIIAKDMENLWADYGDYYAMLLLYEEYTLTRVNPLEPDTEYIAFAYGLSDAEFVATTELCKVVLRTPAGN